MVKIFIKDRNKNYLQIQLCKKCTCLSTNYNWCVFVSIESVLYINKSLANQHSYHSLGNHKNSFLFILPFFKLAIKITKCL